MTDIAYQTVDIDGVKVFYREAGTGNDPKLLLVHGFPTSSHMFRDLIPLLADHFHIVAPDLPSFGHSTNPLSNTFDSIADTIDRLTEVLGFDRYSLYVFDYGAPTGFRLAVRHPERITGIILKTATPMLKGWATAGIRSGLLGGRIGSKS